MPNEYKIIRGLQFVRCNFGGGKPPVFWTFYSDVHAEGTNAPQKGDGGPDIVCDCGNDKFTLRYGNYEMFAKCCNCGVEECVYSD